MTTSTPFLSPASPVAATRPAGEKPPLNILEMASAFDGWGGTEIHVLNLSEQLIRRGHRVTVACRPGKFVEAECIKRNIPTVELIIRSPSDRRAIAPLKALMRQNRYDVVHSHWVADYLLPPILARLTHTPVALLSHHSPHPFKNDFRRFLFRHLLHNRIIALSESVRQMLIVREGMPAQKVVTIHHGTDTNAFRQTTLSPEAVRADWNIAPHSFVVGMAGRIAVEKGILDFLHALLQVKDNPDRPLHAVLIGEGKQDAEVRAFVRANHLENRVTFAGFRSDANNAINALDTLVLASTWAEPCAAVIQQAMALGKPVIGTSIGGTPEMIAGGETGLLVPPGDPDALAQAIVSVRDMDDAARSAMGQAGLVRVESLFTLTGMVDKIEALYYKEREAVRWARPLLSAAPQTTNTPAPLGGASS